MLTHVAAAAASWRPDRAALLPPSPPLRHARRQKIALLWHASEPDGQRLKERVRRILQDSRYRDCVCERSDDPEIALIICLRSQGLVQATSLPTIAIDDCNVLVARTSRPPPPLRERQNLVMVDVLLLDRDLVNRIAHLLGD